MKSALSNSLPFVLLLAITAIADEPPGKRRLDHTQEPWVKRLNADDPNAIEKAVHDLRYLGRGRLLLVKQRLIELVGSLQPLVRQEAIERLTEIGPPAAEALPVLEAHLDDASPKVRIAAAEAVWRIGGRVDLAAPVFIAAIQHDDDTRIPAWHLQKMGSDASVGLPSLLKMMEDPEERIREHAALVLGALGPDCAKQTEQRLVAALDDRSGRVRLAAARALGEIGAPVERAVSVLIELASEEVPTSDRAAQAISAESSVPASAVEALGVLESDAAPAVTTLSMLLTSPVLAIRLEAATALGKIGPLAKEAIPALSAALQDTQWHSFPFAHHSWCVSENAAKALAEIGVAAAPALLTALDDEKPVIRARAADALGRIPAAARETVDPLTRRLDDASVFVRVEAANALEHLGPAALKAAPRLARLLVNPKGVTSFDEALWSREHQMTSDAAWRALLKMDAKAELVMPPLVEALKDADELSYEAICALRKFPMDAIAAKEPLERLLKRDKTAVAAACALAFVDPDHEKIQSVLQEGIQRWELPFFPLGISQLAANDRTFGEDFRTRLIQLAEKQQHVHLWQCVYRMLPDDEHVTQSFVVAVRSADSTFDPEGLAEATITVLELIGNHPRLKQAFVKELELEFEPDEGWSEFDRMEQQSRCRIQAAKILLAARTEVAPAIRCLAQLVEDGQNSADSSAADILSEDASPPPEALPLLLKLLDSNHIYTFGGNFRGNGGEQRIVGDRAALALVNMKATDALLGKLDSKDALVRARVVRALGQIGGRSVIIPLVRRSSDLDYRVRRETMKALGRIGQMDPEARPLLRAPLETAESDPRRSVRDGAAEALAR